MFQPFAISFHARQVDDCRMFIEANDPVSAGAPYYALHFGDRDLTIFLRDEQRRQLLDILSSAPPLPKSDAQIDAEREDEARMPSMTRDGAVREGDPAPDPVAPIFAAAQHAARNAGVAEPLRSMLNAISPEVPRAAMGSRDMHLRRYMSECASGLWRVGGPDAEF